MESTTLNNGIQMSLIGFGTFQLHDDQCTDSVLKAIQIGYRLIDTAEAYGNEAAVGNAIIACNVPREQLFITTKVNFKSYETVEATICQSLQKLQTKYLDLVLLHWPFGNYYAAWNVLEKLYAEGIIRAIGVSNFDPDRLIDLSHFNNIVPTVNQIETNLLCQRKTEHLWLEKYQVTHQAYSPLGQGRRQEMFNKPELLTIAAKHKKTPAQIMLRFLIQQNIAIIPKSANINRIEENFAIFDFVLSPTELSVLSSLDEKTPIIGNPKDPSLVEQAMTW